MQRLSEDEQATISVIVFPSASRNEVVSFAEGVLRVKVSAPPLKGKANKELLLLLSQVLNVSKSRLAVIKGHTSRSKVIAIDGLSREEIRRRLSSSGGATE